MTHLSDISPALAGILLAALGTKISLWLSVKAQRPSRNR